ncbi:hypothetical protein JCM6882_007513 [Rhodosporidiobolus microsporus]
MAHQIPSTLPLLPLPPDQIVLPGLSFSLQLTSRHSVELIRSIVKDASSGLSPATSRLTLGCVPLKAPATPANALAEAANRGEGGDGAGKGDEGESGGAEGEREKGLQVIRVPKEGEGEGELSKGGRPEPEALFDYGTTARIVRLERLSSSSGGGFLLVVEGLARFSYNPLELDTSAPYYSSEVTVHDAALAVLPSSHSGLLTSLRQTCASLLATLSSTLTLPSLFMRRLRSLLASSTLESAPALVDAFIGTIPLSSTPAQNTGLTYADKLLILSLVDPVERVEKGIEILARADEALKLVKRIGERVDKSAQRRQREYALMQQLLAIRAELDELAAEKKGSGVPSAGGVGGSAVSRGGKAQGGRRLPPRPASEEPEEEEDEIAELEKKIEAKAFSEEARKIAVRELKRLKKSPPQGAEHGVIRTYLETLLSLPWTSADATPLPTDKDFIAKARQKLDDDHYGLEKIKKRLLEWLAVLRLQQQQADLLLASAPPYPSPSTPSSATESAVSTLTPSTETAVTLRDSAAPPAPEAPAPAPVPAAPAKPSHPAPILLLHGPPGTGKTSIAKSLAEAMGRKFVRISLGGVRDEAEIRGHRRTYVGAMPGKIINALKKAGTQNPVVLLDEVDKLGHDAMRGAPDAALLEVLDPAQNSTFEDHYLGVPFDLSQVLFIATANSLETISEPLYDRMEPIELSGYVHDEKLRIARQSLLPKQLASHALSADLLSMSDDTLLFLITHFTREAGVRSLDRQLAAVCRAKAVEYAEAKEKMVSAAAGDVGEMREGEVPQGYRTEVTVEDVERTLGTSRYDPEELDKEGVSRLGVSTGLAYQGSGNGGILHIECTSFPGSGKLHLTGQLGDVISESAQVAFAWVKSHAYELGIAQKTDADVFKNLDVHLHLPAGSVKKDGPSAGVAMAVALVSLMTGIPTARGVAMTGEITLRGAVTPVGGIKEKVLAAHRASLSLLILPLRNKRDVESDVPASVLNSGDIEFVYVERVEDALEAAFGGRVRMRARGEEGKEGGWVESRL